MNITSTEIKASLMSYYRFKRGYVCVDECVCTGDEISDVLVDTGKQIYDIEIKVSVSDLIRGEARKRKHSYYRVAEGKKQHPNKFFICVPMKMEAVAKKWVEETNNKYGIIIYTAPPSGFRYKRCDFEYNLCFVKNARSFNSLYSGEYFKERIAKRLSSAYINKKQEGIIKQAREKNL